MRCSSMSGSSGRSHSATCCANWKLRPSAPISEAIDVTENGAYHRLLLLYRGALTPESLVDAPDNSTAALHDSTAGYGIGNWHLYNGRPAEAAEWFRRVYAGPQWAAFGYIAAEAELARLLSASSPPARSSIVS